ncbi:phage tail protein [Cronobacter turicensis]|uniref:Phage tail protein n=1 Tax=Cronobacter turicensis (strain DSM 18703 / CCUG 55852 / LMG 23827 / z3032) TaxID=693216 RepID=C9Y1R8_CROTZ|nr:phage tail protein [Cronobacter turicensis]EMD9176684.1 phage tail protein [Cronobacter turicensis]MDI6473402.1 phage tail protein [Cronobacter turicensis]CBA30122.1 hypothetical protein CTU_17580 [Cronobacter turicensis z3032]
MATETFTWCPRINAGGEVTHRVRRAQFGDGYAQASGDGINAHGQKWDLEFVGDESYITAIMDFLDRHGGSRSFIWQAPLKGAGLYRCDAYRPSAPGGGIFSLTATFTQAFAP